MPSLHTYLFWICLSCLITPTRHLDCRHEQRHVLKCGRCKAEISGSIHYICIFPIFSHPSSNFIIKIHYLLTCCRNEYSTNTANMTLNNNQSSQSMLSWSYVYGSWIHNYMCKQWPSPLKFEFESRSWQEVFDTTIWDKVCQ